MNSTSSRPPIAFAAPAQQELFHAYGDPRVPGWESQWMTLWKVGEEFSWFPKPAIYLHKDFKALLKKAFKELEKKGLHKEIRSCDGCFNIRHVRGSYSVLSVHSWGGHRPECAGQSARYIRALAGAVPGSNEWLPHLLRPALDRPKGPDALCDGKWVADNPTVPGAGRWLSINRKGMC